MPVIGLTGSIASGKSLVTDTLKELGAKVLDADIIARETVQPGSEGFKRVVRVFGNGILNRDGTIDRQALGTIVFGDPKLLKKLNDETHPLILDNIIRAIKEFRDSDKGRTGVLVIDVPLLIETGLYKEVDEVWVVVIPEDLQIKRLIKRDKISCQQAIERISSQMPAREKVKFADIIIDNSGDVIATVTQVKEIWKKRLGEVGVRKN